MFNGAKIREAVEVRLAEWSKKADEASAEAESVIKQALANLEGSHKGLVIEFDKLVEDFEAFKKNVFEALSKDLAELKVAVADLAAKLIAMEATAAESAKKTASATAAAASKKAPKAAATVATDVQKAETVVEADTAKVGEAVENVIAGGLVVTAAQ